MMTTDLSQTFERKNGLNQQSNNKRSAESVLEIVMASSLWVLSKLITHTTSRAFVKNNHNVRNL